MPHADITGTRLHHLVEGSGPPLLLLAGLAGDHHAWDAHVDRYARRFTCVRVDNRGAGGSDAPKGPFTTAQMAADALAVMDLLGFDAFHAAGQSMGGAIVQEILVAAPERVLSAAIHCSWTRCDAYLEDVFRVCAMVRSVCSLAQYNRYILPWLLSPATYERRPDFVRELLSDMDAPDTVQPTAAFADQASACITHDARDALAGCCVPTLLAVGEDDILTPPRFTHELHHLMPASDLVEIPDAGHCFFFEHPRVFGELTADFHARHNNRST